MATVAAYKRALERLYTLTGQVYGLVIVAANPEWSGSNTAARELLLVARSISTEGRVETCRTPIIQGPVVRYDLLTDQPEAWTGSSDKRGVNDVVELRSADIQSAFAGRSLPHGTPLLVALVGVAGSVVEKLTTCIEKNELSSVATGGYVVLEYKPAETGPPMRLSHMTLCIKETSSPTKNFLIGREVIDDSRSFVYAIRVLTPQVSSSGIVITPQAPTPSEPMRVVRAPRWKKQEATPVQSSPLLVVASVRPSTQQRGLEWDSLIQSVVQRELKKLLLGKEEPVTQDLGGGLIMRLWPELIVNISMAREWRSVFTHQSVDPTPRSNYEAFETLGDKVLSLSLVHYLFSDSTRILDSNGLTDSHKEILSSVKQAAMAVSMGFNAAGLIQSSVQIDDNMLEDVYEAFFGCLFMVANRLVDGGNQGLPITEALFRHVLYDTFPSLDPWSVPKDPQTTLDQIFIRLAWGHPLLNYNEESRITTIRLTRDAHAYLESLGPSIKFEKPLAVGPRTADKPSSARAAAEIALTTLKLGWGIDSRYASIVVRNRLMRDERYASVQREAMKIAEGMGYVDIYVARKAKNHNQLYAVIGVKRDDSEVQLHVYKYQSPEARGVEAEELQAISTRVAAYITALREFITAHRR